MKEGWFFDIQYRRHVIRRRPGMFSRKRLAKEDTFGKLRRS